MGCAVIRPYHRGAWGSGGFYSFSHCIEDAEAASAVFELLMGSEVAPRKQFIIEGAEELDLERIDA